MVEKETHVGRVRRALADIRAVMETDAEELSAEDIASWTGLSTRQVLKLIQNNGLLPNVGGGLFLLTRDMPVDYGGKARGPHELFEPKPGDSPKGVKGSRNFPKVEVDVSG